MTGKPSLLIAAQNHIVKKENALSLRVRSTLPVFYERDVCDALARNVLGTAPNVRWNMVLKLPTLS